VKSTVEWYLAGGCLQSAGATLPLSALNLKIVVFKVEITAVLVICYGSNSE
jgi:hypothetical protein